MKLGYSSLGKTTASVEELVSLAVKYNYQGVELRGVEGEHISPAASNKNRKELLSLFKNAGLEIFGLTAYTKFALNNRNERMDNEKILLEYLELARDLECPYVRTFLGKYEGDRLDYLPGIIDSLNTVAEKAAGEPVKILMETHDDWSRTDSLIEILADTPDSVGVLWDMAHSVREKETLEESLANLGSRVGYLHLKDEYFEGEKQIHCLPGKGIVPIKECRDLMESVEFNDFYCLEWEKKWHPEMEELEKALPLFRDLMLNS
jgi:sugar phosphate isomerase/epimerase